VNGLYGMFNYEKPYISSVIKITDLADSADEYGQTVYRMQDVNSVFFRILDQKMKGFSLQDSQRYINFTLVNYFKNIDSKG